MGKDDNPWKPSTAGLEFDIEGPHAEYLIDTSEIYDKIVYPKVHANTSEWEVTNERYGSFTLLHSKLLTLYDILVVKRKLIYQYEKHLSL